MEWIKAVREEKPNAISNICHIQTNSIYEHGKCKLKNISWGGGSEDAACLYGWMDGQIQSVVYVKVRPASLYTLKTFSMALT